jgi:hypothetical protein
MLHLQLFYLPRFSTCHGHNQPLTFGSCYEKMSGLFHAFFHLHMANYSFPSEVVFAHAFTLSEQQVYATTLPQQLEVEI